MRTLLSAAAILVLPIVLAMTLLNTQGGSSDASSVRLKGSRNAEPSFLDVGLTLGAAGALSGLGKEDVLITLSAKAKYQDKTRRQ